MNHSISNPFDILVSNVRTNNTTENLETLYAAFFALEEWNFIVSQDCSFEDARPFIGMVDEKPWIFVFTDGMKATQYAKAVGGFMEQDGNTVVIRVKREDGMNFAKRTQELGVYGIRFNDGENGWFVDIPGFFQIDDHLLQKFLKRVQQLGD